MNQGLNRTGYTGSEGAGFTGSVGPGGAGSIGPTGFTGSASTVIGPTGFTGSSGAGFTGSGGAGFTGSSGAGLGYVATSLTAENIATGSGINWALNPGGTTWVGSTAYRVGMRVRIIATASPTNYVEGTITSFSSGNPDQMFVDVDTAVGAGAFTSWTITVAGNKGFTGSVGAGFTGSTGSGFTGSASTAIGFTGSSVSTQFSRGATWVASSGAVVAPAQLVTVVIPYACTLQEVTIVTQGGPGSCTIDIWKTPFASYPPTSLNTIVGGTLPAIASGITYKNTTFSGWTSTTFAQDDVVAFYLATNTNFTMVSIQLRML